MLCFKCSISLISSLNLSKNCWWKEFCSLWIKLNFRFRQNAVISENRANVAPGTADLHYGNIVTQCSSVQTLLPIPLLHFITHSDTQNDPLTFCRIPLNEWLICRRGLYLHRTTNTIDKQPWHQLDFFFLYLSVLLCPDFPGLAFCPYCTTHRTQNAPSGIRTRNTSK